MLGLLQRIVDLHSSFSCHIACCPKVPVAEAELVEESVEVSEVTAAEEEEEEEEQAAEGEEGAEGAEGAESAEGAAEGAPAEGDPDAEPASPKEKKEEKKKDDDDEEDGPAKEVVPDTLSQVCYYTKEGGGDFVLFVGTGVYSGYLWEMPLGAAPIRSHAEAPLGEQSPTSAMCVARTKLPKGVKVTFMKTSSSEQFLFMGFEDGRSWVIPLKNMALHTVINLGDSTSGRVTQISGDRDDENLVVAAADGTLASVSLNAPAIAAIAEGKKKDGDEVAGMLQDMPDVPSAHPDDWGLPNTESPGFTVTARDIRDKDAYSIQEAKLKSEEDNAKAAAEQKKKRVRDRIQEVRQELEELMQKNANIPVNKLSDTEMIVDQEYIAHLMKDMEKKVEDVRFELAWSVEYHERGMRKLRDFYLSRLDFERIEVRGFRSPHRVSTFRCAAMSADLQSSLAGLHELIFAADKESDDEDEDEDDPASPYSAQRRGSVGLGGNQIDGAGSDAGMGNSQQMTTGAEQRELRKTQRAERKQELQDLEKAKPSEQNDDPQDVESIAQAEATLGNYVLKTSDSYQVPENQRMNAEKKRRQMYLLEESMHAIKTEFNHRVLALRDFRQQVRAEVQRDLAALSEIDQQLVASTPWVAGILDEEPDAAPEFPERRFEYSEDNLQSFMKQLQDAESGAGEAAAAAPVAVAEEEAGEEAQQQEPAGGKGKAAGAPMAGRSALAARRISRLTLRAKILQEQGGKPGSLCKAVAEEARARLWHDKGQLEDHIKQVIDTFNNAVASIEKEKAKLESDLKNADMKLLVLFEELLTLNELEEKDEALLKKATKCRQDKTQIMHHIKECQDQLGEKKNEIEQWHGEEQNLQTEFTELVGDNSPFLSVLLKIYKKKVKRSKRKKGMDDEDMDEEEDEEEDEESAQEAKEDAIEAKQDLAQDDKDMKVENGEVEEDGN
mmetsp:Transcript_8663/g.19045  ORF Transcript_8663/g.19045 Transcript_8663/m.19045 type:complete len:951 (+) Transcript_8663:210-3062(+)